MNRLFLLIIKRPVLFLIISILISLPFIIFLPNVKTVDNVDYFTPDDDPEIVFYKKFQDIFGSDEFFLVAFSDDDIFTKENLEIIKNISEEIELFEEVRDVISLTNVDDIFGSEEYFNVNKFIETIPSEPEELEKLKKSALSNKLYIKNIISKDAKTAAIVVFPYEMKDKKEFRKQLIDKTSSILIPYQQKGRRFYIGGMTVTNLRLSQFMKSDLLLFIPLSYLVIIITIYIIFRSIKIVLIASCNISLCLGATIGFMGMIGATMNNITSIIPSLITAICLSDSIHILSAFLSFSQKGIEKNKALEKTLITEYRPCLFTCFTTFLGFFSLSFNNLPPIRDFAIISSIGVILAYIFSFLLLPPLIVILNPRNKMESSKNVFGHLLERLVDICTNYSRRILLIFICVTVVCLPLIPKIKIETNLLEFFKKSTELRHSIDFIEKHLSGVETIQISLKQETPGAFVNPSNLNVIEAVQNYIAELPEIDTVNSFADFIKDMNMAFHNENSSFYTIPDNQNLISQYLLLYGSDDIDDYINSDYNHARIVARTSIHGSSDLGILLQKIDTFLQNNVPDDFDFRITGETKKVVNIVDYLVKGQINSILTAFVPISVVMLLIMRSFHLGWISLVPNIFPIILNFGIMGLLGIPLNTATSLISAIAIGIVVDDTIHFIHEYKTNLIELKSISAAIGKALLYKGNAIITTAIILFFGFGVLSFSSFIPTIQFGLLTASIMFSALMGEILLLPSMLIFLERKKVLNG